MDQEPPKKFDAKTTPQTTPQKTRPPKTQPTDQTEINQTTQPDKPTTDKEPTLPDLKKIIQHKHGKNQETGTPENN